MSISNCMLSGKISALKDGEPKEIMKQVDVMPLRVVASSCFVASTALCSKQRVLFVQLAFAVRADTTCFSFKKSRFPKFVSTR